MSDAARIAADRTAVVVIEPQYAYLAPDGARYAFIRAALGHQEVVDRLRTFLDGARALGIRVMYVPFHPLERAYPELEPATATFRTPWRVPSSGRITQMGELHRVGYRDEGEICLECGRAWPCDTAVALEEVRRLRAVGVPPPSGVLVGSELGPRLRPEAGDLVVEGSKTLDAFQSTELDRLLRANRIEYLAFTGFHTNWCLESSARSAYDRGYRVILVSDCSASDSPEEQSHSERYIFPRIGQVLTGSQLLAAVQPELAMPQAILG